MSDKLLLPLTEYPGYHVGEDQHIYSTRAYGRLDGKWPTPLKTFKIKTAKNRLCVTLYKDGKSVKCLVSRLICEAFHGPCPVGMECSHIDGDLHNNAPDNLCWETHLDNMRRKFDHGTIGAGESNSMAKLTHTKVHQIKTKLLHKLASQRELGIEFDVHYATISAIYKERIWAEVEPSLAGLGVYNGR